jgi:hypothetical protein
MNKLLIAAAVGLAWLVAPASADTIANFSLDKVTFSDGGTATGGFTLDLTTNTLSNVNITTSLDVIVIPFIGFGTTYDNTGTNTFTNGATADFQFTQDFGVGSDVLKFDVAGPLTALNLAGTASFALTGGSETEFFILCDSQLSECAQRTVTGGSLDVGVSATPLPATLPLFAGGLGLVGLLSRRRKQAKLVAA